MTPELQGAINRVSATLDRYNDDFALPVSEMDEFMEDVRTLLAALDPAEQPIPHVPTQRGINYLRDRRQQHPKTATDA